jgi:hypothetical protein
MLAMGARKKTRSTRWYLLLGALVWLVPSGGKAQAMLMLLFGDKIVTEDFQPGITASFVGSGFWGVSNKMRLSWSIGIYGEIRLTKKLSLQPEFIIKNPGGARDMSTSIPGYPFEPVGGEPMLDDVIENGRVERELRSVAFPVLLKYVVGPIGLGIGPQLNVQTQATDTVRKKENDEKISLEGSVRGALHWYDVSAVGSVEYAFSKGDHLRSFRVRLKGVLGLVDTIKNNPDKPIRNWQLQFGIDIPIGSYKKPADHAKKTADASGQAPTQ